MDIYIEKVTKEDYNYTIFGKRLDSVMRQKGISNQELAHKMFVAASTISGYRTGRRSPDVVSLARMADILQVSADYLIGLTDCPK